MKHTHRAKGESVTIAWTHCVRDCSDGRACSGIAHGGVVLVDHCRCGAVRRVESNGGRTESSGWQDQ